jgi:hypothetical protein
LNLISMLLPRRAKRLVNGWTIALSKGALHVRDGS